MPSNSSSKRKYKSAFQMERRRPLSKVLPGISLSAVVAV